MSLEMGLSFEVGLKLLVIFFMANIISAMTCRLIIEGAKIVKREKKIRRR